MLITNPGKPITVNHWYMLELRSEKTSEETIKRLGKALKERFRGEEAQIFVPVIERDLDTFTLLTECYVFVKADDVYKVAKLRQVTGVQCVVAHEESFHPSKFLKVEDAYVHDLIQKCWNAYNVRSSRIHVGSWVRLLDGQTRNYCGLVLAISGDRALVRIDLKTKILLRRAIRANLGSEAYRAAWQRWGWRKPVERQAARRLEKWKRRVAA